MNNLLLNTEYGEDFRNAQMRSFGKEFQKEIIPKPNQLLTGHILKTERISTCQPLLDQTHSPEPPDLHKLPIKLNLYLVIMVTSILNKNQIELISENQLELILAQETHI